MKKWALYIITFISLLYSFLGYSQTLAEVYNLAEKNHIDGNLYHARTLYLRVAFFDTTNVYSSKAYYKLANIESKLGNFNLAHSHFDRLMNMPDSIIDKRIILLNKAYFYLLEKKYDLASINVNQLNNYNSDTCIQTFKIFLEAAILLGIDSIKASENKVMELQVSEKDSIKIFQIYTTNSKIFSKSLDKAKVMSALVPGLGQIYLGDFKSGINSTFVVGGLGFLFANTWRVYGFLPSFLSVFPWTFRYYLGGITKNEIIWKRGKDNAKQNIYNALFEHHYNKKTFCNLNIN